MKPASNGSPFLRKIEREWSTSTSGKRYPVVRHHHTFPLFKGLTIHRLIELLPLLSPAFKAMYALLLSMLFSLFSSFLQVVPYVVQVSPWISNHLGLVLGGGVASVAMDLFWGTRRRGRSYWTSSWGWWILKWSALLLAIIFPLTSLYLVGIGFARCWFFGLPVIALSWSFALEAGAVWILAVLLAGLTKNLIAWLTGLVKKCAWAIVCTGFRLVKTCARGFVCGGFRLVKLAITGLVLQACKVFVRGEPQVAKAKASLVHEEDDGLSDDESSVESVVEIAPSPRRSPRSLQRVDYKVFY